jgi:hypothetical protein
LYLRLTRKAGPAFQIPTPSIIMKILAALAFVALSSGAALADNCTVNPNKPAKPGVTAKHKGKEYGFCCNNCKAKFEADPEKYIKK